MKMSEKGRGPIYKNRRLWVLVFAFVVVLATGLAGCSAGMELPPTDQTETQAPASSLEPSEALPDGDSAETTTEPDITFEFDVLQSGFISISENTTIEDILSFVDENSLFYTEQEYNTTTGGKTVQYKIAYEKGVSYQSHADSGDYLKIEFDRDNGDIILNAQYVNSRSHGYSALFYSYGTWYDFSNQNAEDYSGYYNVKSLGGNNEGIIVKYNNGNEAHTNYFLCNSPQEAIENILMEIGAF